VIRRILRRGDPDYGQPGYRGIEDRPWLPAEPPPNRSSLDDDISSIPAWVDEVKPARTRKRGIR
jgi:hypothetical protein